MMEMLRRFVVEEEGQGMAEYALILALVAILLIAGFTYLKNGINNVLNNTGNKLNNPGS